MEFLIAWLFSDDLVFQIGIALLVACPGGLLSNSFVYVARGRTDLSVTLTAINGFLVLLTTSLIASLGIKVVAGQATDINLPLLKTVAQIFSLVILPVVIGMSIRAQFPAFAASRQIAAQRLGTFLLIYHIFLVISLHKEQIEAEMSEMILPAMLFCILAQAIGYFSAMAVGLDRDTRFTIGIKIGLQNVALAVLIVNIALQRLEFSLFVVNYAFGVIFVMIPWVFIYRYLGRHQKLKSLNAS